MIPPTNCLRAFYGINSSIPIYVHASALKDYQVSPAWSAYASRLLPIENIAFYSYSTPTRMLFNSTETIEIPIIIKNNSIPTNISVTSSNLNVATVSNIVNNNNTVSFNINTLNIEDTVTITVSLSQNDEIETTNFSISVLETIPVAEYSVENVTGANYGFTLNNNGYYESNNKGINSSYAICKVKIISDGTHRLYLDCINYAESSWDYGILSKLDTTLSLSNTADTNYFKSFSGLSQSTVQTVDYGIIPEGEHFIYAKYLKDSSVNSNNDSLQFKVRLE
jgi:hypothetical protein